MSRTKTKRQPRTTSTRPQLRPVPAASAGRPPLPVREFITEPAIRAHYDALLNGLPTTAIRDWTPLPGGGSTTNRGHLGTLTHTPSADAPFQAVIRCTTGHLHTTAIRYGQDLAAAENQATTCTNRHGTPALVQAVKVLPLPEGRHRAEASEADTHQMSVQDIAEGLAERAATTAAADADQAKEHPEP